MTMTVLHKIKLPCGGLALFEEDSTCYSYRCIKCMAVVNSIGMPALCKEEMNKWENWKHLGGQGWDYEIGEINEMV